MNIKKVLALGMLGIGLGLTCHAQVIVVLKNGQVERRDAKTGSYRGAVGNSKAVAAASDGVIIAIAYANGSVSRYDAETGSYKGSVGSGFAVDVQVTAGLIVVRYKDGRTVRYDAKTGAYKGTL